jgi:uncharacterized CHY-type Zn-finger protein
MFQNAVLSSNECSIEVIPPSRAAAWHFVVCGCCRRSLSASEFDEDSCGICFECIGADPLLCDHGGDWLAEPK